MVTGHPGPPSRTAATFLEVEDAAVDPQQAPAIAQGFHIPSNKKPTGCCTVMEEDQKEMENAAAVTSLTFLTQARPGLMADELANFYHGCSFCGDRCNVEGRNQTDVANFFLLAITDDPALHLLIFSLFLSMYLVTIMGNLLIILAISSDSHLHTPMYFLLSNLSFTDICMSTTTIPKMLVNIQAQDQSITYIGCLTQACFVLFFAGLENCLLAAMAYDRYVAICHPLKYTIIMNSRLCALLVLLSLPISMLNALLLTVSVLRLSFCTDLEISLFFCELAQIIKLACSDTIINNILIYVAAFIFGGVPFSGIVFSYALIVSSVLRIPSVRGRSKAFSTCGSHLTVVSLFYGTGLGVYVSSAVMDSSRKTGMASLMYSVVPQITNPFIYSLRNRDMKESLRKFFSRVSSVL
ncbi:olfactory receptor 7G2-like [Heterocephalus glaber]|uniref:Olfactory receptor 7G2-like n=1 Tax=Heterocephalus glaber TaxID=10181 RepID=A0AAX6QPA7_HETGA|nr:olfactory receptor 7G2-like [Heterocephalus glaber]